MSHITALTALCQTFLPDEQIWQTPIADLTLYRLNSPQSQISHLQEPSICVILQGEKQVYLDEHVYCYGTGQFACYSIDLPIRGEVATGSPELPNLGIKLNLNCEILLDLMREMQLENLPEKDDGVLTIGTLNPELSEAFERLVRLLNSPKDIPILAPLIQREIYYRLITSEQGARLRKIISQSGHLMQISQAIQWLKQHFTKPLNIDELAALSGMGLSSFYQHFRYITGVSPLQYQKQLRLCEAQRLIKTKALNLTLAHIAYQVGYESPSQFSREYKRYFGKSPSEE